MKTYYSVLLAAWSTGWATHSVMKVGTAYAGGEYTWSLPVAMTSVIFVTALLGFLIGSSK